jgi:hypothetical protein
MKTPHANTDEKMFHLQTPTVKDEIRRYSSQYNARPKRPSSEPHGVTRQQTIAKTSAK